MAVTMVQVGVVRVLVSQRFMSVPMRMRLRVGTVTTMLVVFVMCVHVLMLERFMGMLVFVPLRQVHPQADGHQRACSDELWRHDLPEKNYCQKRSDERSQRIIRAGTRCAQMAQGKNEHDEADANCKKAERLRGSDHE
jgi:hypothetical protein